MSSVLQADSLAALAGELAERFGSAAVEGGPARAESGTPEPADGLARGAQALSLNQRGLWFLQQMEGPSATYNMSAALELTGTVHVAALAAALGEIARRHDSLRTTFALEGDQPVQRVGAAIPSILPMVRVDEASVASSNQVLEHLAALEARRPFHLDVDAPLRARLVSLSDERHVLLVTMHHLVSDGWSMVVFLRELTELYARYAGGEPSPLATLLFQYAEYALREQGRLDERALALQEEYWQETLAGLAPLHHLPTDRPRPEVQTFRGPSSWGPI
jgi:hypothetical protein